MSEYSELKQEIAETRREMRQGFKEIQEWQRDVDMGMKGNEEYDVWGHQQKINYNKEKIDSLEKSHDALESRLDKIYWTAIGVGTTAATAAGIIINLILKQL